MATITQATSNPDTVKVWVNLFFKEDGYKVSFNQVGSVTNSGYYVDAADYLISFLVKEAVAKVVDTKDGKKVKAEKVMTFELPKGWIIRKLSKGGKQIEKVDLATSRDNIVFFLERVQFNLPSAKVEMDAEIEAIMASRRA